MGGAWASGRPPGGPSASRLESFQGSTGVEMLTTHRVWSPPLVLKHKGPFHGAGDRAKAVAAVLKRKGPFYGAGDRAKAVAAVLNHKEPC